MKIPKYIRKERIIKAYYFKEVKIPKKFDEDLAYFIGILRDGVITSRRGTKGEYVVEIYQKNIVWLKKIVVPLIEKLFGVKPKVTYQKHGKFLTGRVRIYSKLVYMFLKEVFEHPDTRGQKTCWKTPNLIFKANKKIQKAYVQGFFDAEGHISKNLNAIVIGQAWDKDEKSPLSDIKSILNKFAISNCYLYQIKDKRPNRKPMEILRISNRKGIRRFILEIGSKHPEKQKRFKQFLDLFAPV